MSAPTDLYDLASEFLDACVEALDTIPLYAPLEGAPTRSFVSPGQPAFDCCDQLAVQVLNIAQAPTTPAGLDAGTRHRHGAINHVTLLAYATRCVPTGEETATSFVPPSETELQAAAEQIDADGWALWNHLYNLQRNGLLLDECKEVFFDGVRSITPSGGCGGYVATVRAWLDGYPEALGT